MQKRRRLIFMFSYRKMICFGPKTHTHTQNEMSKEKWNNEHYVSCHFFWMLSIAFGSGDRWSLIAKLFQLIRQCDRIIPTTTTTQSKQQFIDKWNIVSVAIGFHSMKVQWMHVCVARSPIRYKKKRTEITSSIHLGFDTFFSRIISISIIVVVVVLYTNHIKHFVFYFFSFEFVFFSCTLIYNVVRSIEK